MPNIDIKFDFRSDTPEGKDADTYSSTLRSYHQILWSKCLPNGKKFDLDLNTPHLLHHNSTLGEFFLSSDAIGHTYKNAKRMSHIIEKIPSQEIEEFYSLTLTIGAFIIFPSKTIDELKNKGHKISVDTEWSLGRMTAASKENGILKGAANPRFMQGYAIGR